MVIVLSQSALPDSGIPIPESINVVPILFLLSLFAFDDRRTQSYSWGSCGHLSHDFADVKNQDFWVDGRAGGQCAKSAPF